MATLVELVASPHHALSSVNSTASSAAMPSVPSVFTENTFPRGIYIALDFCTGLTALALVRAAVR